MGYFRELLINFDVQFRWYTETYILFETYNILHPTYILFETYNIPNYRYLTSPLQP